MELINQLNYFSRIKALGQFLLVLFLSVFLTSCQENSSDMVNPTAGGDNVSVGFFAERPDNTALVLTEAKFVLHEMVLKYEHHENDCGVKMGPFIVNLDLTPKFIPVAITTIPQGNYDAIKFKVHKPRPNDNISDPDFIVSNSERYSVVVRGFYSGIPFVYKTDLTVSKKIDFEGAPVTVAFTPKINLTIRVNPHSWFIESGMALDPSIESNRHKINKNIKESLRRAFKDMDEDGDPD